LGRFVFDDCHPYPSAVGNYVRLSTPNVAPRTDKHTLYAPQKNIKVTIWFEKPQPVGMEAILRATTAIVEFDIDGKKYTTPKFPLKDLGDMYILRCIERVGNQTYCLDYSSYNEGKCVYSFFDNPVIPYPMKEYEEKIKAKGF
jgi:hypothetical protein